MKPECEACQDPSEGNLSSLLGREMMEKLLYGLFNPESLPQDGREMNMGDSAGSEGAEYDQMLDEFAGDLLRDSGEDWGYRSWVQEKRRRELMREKAWNELIKKLKSGELNPKNIPLRQLLKAFHRKIVEGLAEEGLIDLKLQRHLKYPDTFLGYAEFTPESEKLIAKRVLEEAFSNLQKLGLGSHEVRESGFGLLPSSVIRDFDEQKHPFDLLDIQESLINTAFRDPVDMMISEDDLKARIPYHKARSSNVILLDISNSMYGNKFKGGLMAALALTQLFEEEFKEDTLNIVAYNDEPFIVRPGHMLKLRPYGFTDIGKALMMSIQILSKEEGNRNVFLITDSEPTASAEQNLSPIEHTFRAAYLTRRESIRLNIIMLDRKPILRAICEQAARLSGDSTVAYVDNPLNLKEFFIKTILDSKRRRIPVE